MSQGTGVPILYVNDKVQVCKCCSISTCYSGMENDCSHCNSFNWRAREKKARRWSHLAVVYLEATPRTSARHLSLFIQPQKWIRISVSQHQGMLSSMEPHLLSTAPLHWQLLPPSVSISWQLSISNSVTPLTAVYHRQCLITNSWLPPTAGYIIQTISTNQLHKNNPWPIPTSSNQAGACLSHQPTASHHHHHETNQCRPVSENFRDKNYPTSAGKRYTPRHTHAPPTTGRLRADNHYQRCMANALFQSMSEQTLMTRHSSRHTSCPDNKQYSFCRCSLMNRVTWHNHTHKPTHTSSATTTHHQVTSTTHKATAHQPNEPCQGHTTLL